MNTEAKLLKTLFGRAPASAGELRDMRVSAAVNLAAVVNILVHASIWLFLGRSSSTIVFCVLALLPLASLMIAPLRTSAPVEDADTRGTYR